MAYKKKTKKSKRHLDTAIVHVKSTFNNTIISVSTIEGEIIASSSSGMLGFKGSRKGTPFAATQIATNVANKIKDFGVRTVDVRLKGPGAGRDAAVRALNASGLGIGELADVTPLPHNGCRPAKRRRV